MVSYYIIWLQLRGRGFHLRAKNNTLEKVHSKKKMTSNAGGNEHQNGEAVPMEVSDNPASSGAAMAINTMDGGNNANNDASSGGSQPSGHNPAPSPNTSISPSGGVTNSGPSSIPQPHHHQQSIHHADAATPPPPQPAMEPIQSIAQRLLSLRGSPPGTLANLAENEIKLLCQRVRPILLAQPMLLELEAPLKICGDIHGQFTDLLRLFEYGGFPPESNYLFLGDYVDRGKQSLETVCLLICYKIMYPENFFILRGNHESAGINRIYGFYDECKRRYSIRLWKVFSDVFNCLPVSAIVDEKILCMHGGLSPEMERLQQIADLHRPCDVPDVGLMCDLLWSDPDTGVNVSLCSKKFPPSIELPFCKLYLLFLFR